MIIEVMSEDEMKRLGEVIGRIAEGGDVIELRGDVGAGKTTFTKGLARGLGVTEDVQSPSFTISRTYEARDELRLAHYDFYRLQDPGIMLQDIKEAVDDPDMVTVVEWGELAHGVLPDDRIQIAIVSPSETARRVTMTIPAHAAMRFTGELDVFVA